MSLQHCGAAGSRFTPAEVPCPSFSMHRRAGAQLWPSVCRLHVLRRNSITACRVLSAQSGEPKATPALLDKIKDKDLLKVHGFIGGQWVPASDGTTMEVLKACLLVLPIRNLACYTGTTRLARALATYWTSDMCPLHRSRTQLPGKS